MALTLLDYLGIFAFALSGALKGLRKQLDPFGVLVLALATAVGGGTIRDVVLGNIPPYWLSERNYVLLVIAATLIAVGMPRLLERTEGVILFFDAIGLGLYTVIGATKAMEKGLGGVGVVALACVTACGGGMIRDLLAAEVPVVLRKEIYASASILGALLILGLQYTALPSPVSLTASAIVVVVLRLLALRFHWGLPAMKAPVKHDDETRR
jgi:uncharacterized membrane protein YeiH